MSMFLIRKPQSTAPDKLHLTLTKAYLGYLRGEAPKIDKRSVDLINKDPDRLVDLLRYTLLTALDCRASENFQDMRPLYPKLVKEFRRILKPYNFATQRAKEGLVQACMHCVIQLRTKGRIQ